MHRCTESIARQLYFQSISDASGVNLSTSIFSGSKFPGSVTYSKAYDSEGNYAVPGLANYVTHGNSDTFGTNWSENLPGVPSFSAGFQVGTSDYSVSVPTTRGTTRSIHSISIRAIDSRASTWLPTIHSEAVSR